MDNTQKTIIIAIAEFLCLSLLALSAPLIIAIDILIIGHGVSETSLTELTQEALLLLSALLFGISAWRRPQSRGFLTLVSGFFSCMFIRELDAFFDHLVYHGFWCWPAIFVAVGSTTYAFSYRKTISAAIANFIGTKSYYHILFGLIILLVLSRSLCSGSLLWQHIIGDNYSRELKAALQEGLELFGYILICSGSFLFLRHKEGVHVNHGTIYTRNAQ